MPLFLILVLHFTGAVTTALSLPVRDGADVTLRCESLIDGQEKCDGTTWIFSNSRSSSAVELFTLGQTGKEVESKSDRLSVTENCSLVIKKVTAEDVGRYTCRQFGKSGRQQGRDNVVDLSVVTMTEQKDTDKLTLLCSLWTYGRCIYTVKWLLKGNDVDKDNKNLKTSQSPCNVTLTFLTSHFIYPLRDKSFTCDVTNRDQRFTFTFQPTGEDTITATTQSTTDWWRWYIVVAVVFVALLILVAAIIRWKRAKGNKTPMNDSIALSSKSAVTQSAPETSQDTVDPEDGVSYASISFTTKANSKARVQMKSNDNKGEAITYATVNASSTDPSDLYASII